MADKYGVPTYKALFDGLLNANTGNMTLCILSQMATRDCKPEEVTYNTIINWLIKERGTDEALQIHRLQNQHRHLH